MISKIAKLLTPIPHPIMQCVFLMMTQMSMSEAQLELNIREQVDSEAILREDMGDNPLITLFSGT